MEKSFQKPSKNKSKKTVKKDYLQKVSDGHAPEPIDRFIERVRNPDDVDKTIVAVESPGKA